MTHWAIPQPEDSPLTKRVKSFIWRLGALAALSGGTYLMNIQNVREIEWDKLLTFIVTAVSALIVSEITKYLNTNQ